MELRLTKVSSDKKLDDVQKNQYAKSRGSIILELRLMKNI
jgi:hypothetical protein